MSRFRLCHKSEMNEGEVKVFHTKYGGVMLKQYRDSYYACQEHCTHDDFSLADGAFVDDLVVECPAHGARFRIDSGEAIALPASAPLEIYPVELVNDYIEVEIN